MATKDITDAQVVQAFHDGFPCGGLGLLEERTGQPAKVCWRAAERAERRDLLEYGIGLHGSWVTEKGKSLLVEASP